jgi:hypothetical protein
VRWHLNGWQRAWVVCSVVLGVVFALVASDTAGGVGLGLLLLRMVLWTMIVGVPLYIFGWAVAWVVRGFKDGGREGPRS